MKTVIAILATFLASTGVPVFAALKYELKITNGSNMPLSPSVIYVRNGQAPTVQVGATPTRGFIKLCQSGNPADRAMELRSDSSVRFATQTMGLILPGESRVVEVDVENPAMQSVHFETMYGKTKDACAVVSVGSHSLYALKQHVTSEVFGKDDVLLTDAFLDPVMPMYGSPVANVCLNKMDSVSCLRELALPNPGAAKVRFFAPYLPSLITFLEQKYGSMDVLSLIFPASGAVKFQLKLKH